ncbi:MAG TPA: 3-isopropylmalate dehydratase large subunit [Polyangiaceae bacterium]|nr:3-isopropylmalate dehydratase large subunit [Polyangiaceae bacterium]
MGQTLYDKLFDSHTVAQLPSGQYQLFMGLHLLHEVTSPQAFSSLDERGLSVAYPERSFATADHIIPTHTRLRPLQDSLAEEMLGALESNVTRHNIPFFSPARREQGIVHVLGPELGLTQPGMMICCGDSHTSTHGAFGSLAFGIGTSQVRDVLATQTLTMNRLKVRKIEIFGKLKPGVYAKDVALYVIHRLGVQGGVGFTYEYAGEVVERFSMDERMTLCNMSIEGGARAGYINPDATTYEYLRGRRFAPSAANWDRAVRYWESVRSDADAVYADVVRLDGSAIEPMVTWGITPGQSVGVSGAVPDLSSFPPNERETAEEAYRYMSFEPGQAISGTKVDVAFIGSCTNGRLSDFEEVARLIQKSQRKVAPGVRALIVPGSQSVRQALIDRGYDKLFTDAGFEFREPGCSMCLAMNPDKLQGRQVCASSSNRNFKGRQGSPSGRTLLMSPAMVAAAALAGSVTDARQLFDLR